MGCDKCGSLMPLITTIEDAETEPLRVFECTPCARGIIVAAEHRH
ncbi:MAG TPA: hypothetical protein V6D05_06985 [Stenomitos sp.]